VNNKNCKVVIVGAGVIGTQCALHIRALLPDAAITVIDQTPFAYDNASCGNVGGLATSEVHPLARPKNLFRALRWAINPLAPFTMRLRYMPDYLPWALWFIRAALTPGHFAHVTAVQESLMKHAHDAHLDTIGDTPLRDLISADGAICIYKTEARMRHDWDNRWRQFRSRGEQCEMLSQTDLLQRLPDLEHHFQYAVHAPSIRHWKSPAALLRGLHQMVMDRGVSLTEGSVADIGTHKNQAHYVLLADGTQVPCDFVVVAAGAWSRPLCLSLGDRVPLDTERGYATTLPRDRSRINHLLLFPNDEFVATPMLEGLRIGGTVELAGLKAPPNFERTQMLVQSMKSYFPTIDTEGRSDWMGFRPSLPDGLPVIGRSPTTSNAFYAFGHGHVGLTQSAITGRLLAQALCDQVPDVDLKPFSIARFR